MRFLVLLLCVLCTSVPTAFAQTTVVPELTSEVYGENATGACAELSVRFTTGQFEISDIACYVTYLTEFLIWLTASIAVLFVVVGGYQYMLAGASDDKEAGKKTILYALIGLAITAFAWTMVNVTQVLVTGGEVAVGQQQPIAAEQVATVQLSGWDISVDLPPTTPQNTQDIEERISNEYFSSDMNEAQVVEQVKDIIEDVIGKDAASATVRAKKVFKQAAAGTIPTNNTSVTAVQLFYACQDISREFPERLLPLSSAYIAAEEGFLEEATKDGAVTQEEVEAGEKLPFTVGIGHQVAANFTWEESEIEPQTQAFFKKDVDIAQEAAKKAASSNGVNFEKLSPIRQMVLTNMAFQMGQSGLSKFKKMFSYLQQAENETSPRSKQLYLSYAAGQIVCNDDAHNINSSCETPSVLHTQTQDRAKTYAAIFESGQAGTLRGRIAEKANDPSVKEAFRIICEDSTLISSEEF